MSSADSRVSVGNASRRLCKASVDFSPRSKLTLSSAKAASCATWSADAARRRSRSFTEAASKASVETSSNAVTGNTGDGPGGGAGRPAATDISALARASAAARPSVIASWSRWRARPRTSGPNDAKPCWCNFVATLPSARYLAFLAGLSPWYSALNSASVRRGPPTREAQLALMYARWPPPPPLETFRLERFPFPLPVDAAGGEGVSGCGLALALAFASARRSPCTRRLRRRLCRSTK